MMSSCWAAGIGEERKGSKEELCQGSQVYTDSLIQFMFLVYVRIQVLTLQMLGWAQTVHSAGTEVTISFSSKVI